MNTCRCRGFVLSIVAVAALMSCGTTASDNVFDAILDLFEEYDVVHLGERHWNMTDYNFRVSFVNYPRFAEVVDDIVIESGNYRYQDILDDYILELKDVPRSELQKVWRNTVVPTGVWDATIYKDFIHAVRSVNGRLPRGKRVRVIAAEPPIDWQHVSTADEWMSYFSQRSTHTPKVIKSEVIDQGRRALVIYGAMHFYKSTGRLGGCARNIRANLEELTHESVFSISPLSGDEPFVTELQEVFADHELPVFVDLRTSELAELGQDYPLNLEPGRLGDMADGVLYFGPGPDLEAEFDPEAAIDTAYQAESERRRAIKAECY